MHSYTLYHHSTEVELICQKSFYCRIMTHVIKVEKVMPHATALGINVCAIWTLKVMMQWLDQLMSAQLKRPLLGKTNLCGLRLGFGRTPTHPGPDSHLPDPHTFPLFRD